MREGGREGNDKVGWWDRGEGRKEMEENERGCEVSENGRERS